MSRFKVGEFATYKNGEEQNAKDNGHYFGKTYKVIAVDDDLIQLEGGNFSLASRLRKVVGPATDIDLNNDHVVMLYEDGKYLPASEPKVYRSDRQAMHVAKSMSKKHGGKFVAFRAIGEAELPQVEPTVKRYA